jgi:hypothetical protein
VRISRAIPLIYTNCQPDRTVFEGKYIKFHARTVQVCSEYPFFLRDHLISGRRSQRKYFFNGYLGVRSPFFGGKYLNFVNTDFPCFAWPVWIWGYINEDGDGIQRAHACDGQDYIHLCNMIATDYFDQPGYLEDIPS